MSQTVQLIGGCALITIFIKGIGPFALGGREVPAAFQSVVALLAPALLAALVVSEALADGKHLHVGDRAVGVATAGLLYWRTRSIIACVITAAGVTALLRQLS